VRKIFIASALLLAVATPIVAQTALAQTTETIRASAIADITRPLEDKARDTFRKPNEMLRFGMVSPGQKVGEILPGGGYFTRVFSKTVGQTGKVYAVINPPAPGAPPPKAPPPVKGIAASPGYGNIVVLEQPLDKFKAPERLDLVWTSQNYHDLHNREGLSLAAVNKAVFDALKPGGYYIVLDHAAATGAMATKTLHRIDPEIVKKEVTSVGFVFDGENNDLRNPMDDKSKPVFDPALRGQTDQFVYRFKKPAR